ncbi:MAG: carboxymuconolactone decarboxylase family protein [Acidimicrobiales bacterium]
MSARLPQLTPADLDAPQRAFYDSLVANEVHWAQHAGARAIADDGSLLGPFNPLLFNPDLGAAQVGVFRADQRSTSLSPRVHEIIILTVGAAWQSAYELYAHRSVAEAAGLPDIVIEAIASGRRPDFDADHEAIAYDFTRQLAHDHRVDHATYARAAHALGETGAVDMVMLIGLYLTTCAIINAFEIPVPEPSAR